MFNQQTAIAAENKGAIAYTILIDDEPLPRAIEIYGMYVCKEVNRIPVAKVSFVDGEVAAQDFEISNQDWLVPGNEISINLGYLNEEKPIFKGVIINHQITIRENFSLLEIECRDFAYLMTLNRQGRYFEKMADSKLIEELLKKYGLKYEVDPNTPLHGELVQYDCTDWDMVVARADCNGLLVIVDDGVVRVKAPDFGQAPTLGLVYGVSIIEFDGKVESRNQFEQVRMRAWNPATQQELERVAAQPDIQENGNLPGLKLAKDKQGARAVHRHGGALKDTELQAWANARMLKSRLSRTCGRVQMAGNNAIKPGQIVMLEGLGNRFNGPVFVSAVRQEYLEEGWLTEAEFGLSSKWFAEMVKMEAPPAAGMLASISGLQTGIVTERESDPEGQHRVRVRIPVLGPEAGGIWARIATLDAGAGRGSFFLPDPGDEVILGFIQDDPREAVVLGMLHSSRNAPPFETSQANDKKGFVSREQLKFFFDEKERAIILETPAGNMLKISDEAESKGHALALADRYGNSIQMGSDGIRINSQKDIVVNAQASFKAKAGKALEGKTNGQMRLNASGVTEIKGNPVNIN